MLATMMYSRISGKFGKQALTKWLIEMLEGLQVDHNSSSYGQLQ